MSDDLPLVSILVTAYNYGLFIIECLNSILTQDYKNIEVVIVDDRSTDDTFDLVRGWRKEHPEIRSEYFYSSEWLGQSKAKNMALHLSTGPLVFFLDADNKFNTPLAISTGVKIMLEHPEVGFVYSDRQFIGNRDDMFPSRHLGKDIFHTNYVDGNMLSRRVAFGEYDEKVVKFTDWDRVLHMVTTGWKGHWVHELLVGYRFHASNTGMMHNHRSAEMHEYITKKYERFKDVISW